MINSKHSAAQIFASRPGRLITSAALAVALSVTPALASPAFADSQSDIEAAQQQIDSSAAAYNEAQSKLDELQQKIDDNTASIAELEAKMPEQKQKAAKAMKELYKYRKGNNSIVTTIVNAANLNDFLTTCTYMDQITSSSTDEIEQLAEMQSELEKSKNELQASKSDLESQKEEASNALAKAQKVRAEAQARAEQEAAEQLAHLESVESSGTSDSGTDSQNTSNTATATNQKVDTSTSTSGSVNWSSDKSAFVSQWASRINNYLAGSPLAGHGQTFAEAAWDNGVDPRWSPAIATIESGKGAACFRPYNAWGWMGKSFGDWDSAIRAHVAYLKSMYGSTLTPQAAKTYCPPTWQDWYNKVAAQMNAI